MRNPICLVRERKKEMMEDPRKEDSRNSESTAGEAIGEIETPRNVVGERKSQIGNPNTVLGGGRNEAIENSDSDSIGKRMESSKSLVLVGKTEVDTPPVDDCCPICFGNFTIPCKTNCGHWFCASCILQFWNYRAALLQCKCPICCRLISKLTPKASLRIQQEEEVINVLKNVQRYNCLCQGGAYGLMLKVLELFKRMWRGLMDPDRFRFNYYTMRIVAMWLTLVYNIRHFDFIPTGGLGIVRFLDFFCIGVFVFLCLVGICRRVMLRRRVRLLAAAQPRDA